MRSRVGAADIPIAQFPGGPKIYIDVRDIEDFIERNKMRYERPLAPWAPDFDERRTCSACGSC
jgi:hypothetical protein